MWCVPSPRRTMHGAVYADPTMNEVVTGTAHKQQSSKHHPCGKGLRATIAAHSQRSTAYTSVRLTAPCYAMAGHKPAQGAVCGQHCYEINTLLARLSSVLRLRMLPALWLSTAIQSIQHS